MKIYVKIIIKINQIQPISLIDAAQIQIQNPKSQITIKLYRAQIPNPKSQIILLESK